MVPAGYTESVVACIPFVDACTSGARVQFIGQSSPVSRFGLVNSGPISLPFTLSFWGSEQTAVFPTVNGTLGFNVYQLAGNDGGNGNLPSYGYSSGPGPMIAPFWDGLFLGPAPESDICYTTAGTAPARTFVVEWRHARRYGVRGSDLRLRSGTARDDERHRVRLPEP